MQKIFLAALVAALTTAGAGNAATYTPDITTSFFSGDGKEGLRVREVYWNGSKYKNYSGSSLNFDLDNLGDSVSFDIFGLTSREKKIGTPDLIEKAGSVTFDFGGGIGPVTLDGTTAALGSGTQGFAQAQFQDSFVKISDTQLIRISLTDTRFANDGVSPGFIKGGAGTGFVNATFTLAAVPIPATLPLVATGLGLLGMAGFRRKKRQAAV